MKKISIKTLIITCVITLLPILLGLSVYGQLPDKIAIHWGLDNESNGWAGKNFVVFGLPFLMMLLQIFSCVINDLKRNKNEESPKLIKFVIWLIPALSIILYCITIAIAMSHNLDIRRIVCLILSVVFIVMGNYIPKISYGNSNLINKPANIPNERVWRIFSRVMGISLIAEGLLLLASLFLPPIATVVAIGVVICSVVGLSIYGIVLSKK